MEWLQNLVRGNEHSFEARFIPEAFESTRFGSEVVEDWAELFWNPTGWLQNLVRGNEHSLKPSTTPWGSRALRLGGRRLSGGCNFQASSELAAQPMHPVVD